MSPEANANSPESPGKQRPLFLGAHASPFLRRGGRGGKRRRKGGRMKKPCHPAREHILRPGSGARRGTAEMTCGDGAV